MASGCIIPNLETTHYSSPVPVIGLYIAAGSSVCLLLMLFDIISAYRRSQSWIPCRFFKINSFTLTLLSIASKLQVDLTTPMPGVPDQLLKLTGTTLLCICMGFFNPSVANNGGSEYLSNMAALSIMIITVVVNIAIQLYTGVIHRFITEHIIIMCCTFLVLLLMWNCAHETKVRNLNDIQEVTYQMTARGNRSLLQRLKACYARGFDKNRQLRACRSRINIILLFFCWVCFCVLVQATVRSVVLKKLRLCIKGGSDYDWSTWFILLTQYLTIIVGCLAIFFRWFATFRAMQFDVNISDFVGSPVSMERKFISILGSSSLYKFGIHLLTCSWYMVEFLAMVVLYPQIYLFRLVGVTLYEEESPIISTSTGFDDRLCKKTVEKVMNDIDRCVEESKRDLPEELFKLFSSRTPSPQFRNLHEQGILVSPLSIATLVKIAVSCLPQALTQTLAHCFREVVDILQIGNDPNDEDYHMFMKNPLFVEENCGAFLLRDVKEISESSTSPLHHAGFILSRLVYFPQVNYDHRVIKAITRQRPETVEELYSFIEQLFVDMLHSLFRELPNAIIKVATESPMDEYKDRVRQAMVTLLKFTPLENVVNWSFPENYGITSLISPQPMEVNTLAKKKTMEVNMPSDWITSGWKELEEQINQNFNFWESWGRSPTPPRQPPEEEHVLRMDNTDGVGVSSRSTHHHFTMEIEEL